MSSRSKAKKKPCPYCSRTGLRRNTDHIIPKGRGGTNANINLLKVCQPCNTAKMDLTPREFYWYCLDYLIRKPKTSKRRIIELRINALEIYVKSEAYRSVEEYFDKLGRSLYLET